MPAIRNRRGSGRLYVRYAGAGLSHDALGSGNAHKEPSAMAFKKAFDDGHIVRLHLMRGTWQIVSAANYWWLLELCAPRAISVIKGFMSGNKIAI